MCEIVKDCMSQRVSDLRTQFVSSNKQMDLIHEVSKTFIKIILTCAFGEDLSEKNLVYYENGVKTEKTVAFVLRNSFHLCMRRWHTLQISIFPESVFWYLSSHDREVRRNIYTMRSMFLEVV